MNFLNLFKNLFINSYNFYILKKIFIFKWNLGKKNYNLKNKDLNLSNNWKCQ